MKNFPINFSRWLYKKEWLKNQKAFYWQTFVLIAWKTNMFIFVTFSCTNKCLQLLDTCKQLNPLVTASYLICIILSQFIAVSTIFGFLDITLSHMNMQLNKNMKGDVTECHCTHVWHVSLNQYGYHITNMSYTAIMLNGHMDPTIVHRCAKTKQTLISNAHVVAIYVPERNMAWKLMCHICQIFDGLIWKIYNIYMPHMMCQSSIMQQGALYTYLTYITAQLLLAHQNIAYRANVVHEYKPKMFALICQNTANFNGY